MIFLWMVGIVFAIVLITVFGGLLLLIGGWIYAYVFGPQPAPSEWWEMALLWVR